MNGSGKEVLLRILSELSTRLTSAEDLPSATRKLRGGLLVHGSTSEDSMANASRIVWASDCDESGAVKRQGIALGNGQIFVSDLYEAVFEMPGLSEHVRSKYPALTQQDFEAFEWVMWLLVSSVQMFAQLNPIEGSSDIDVEAWVDVMMRAYEAHLGDH